MLGIDISTLSTSELRRLLALARDRDQEALVERFSAELAMRGGPGGRRRRAKPQPRPEDEALEPDPIGLYLPELEPELDFDRSARRAPRRRGWPFGVAVAAGIALAAGAAAWTFGGAPVLSRVDVRQPTTPPSTQPRAMTVRPAPAEPVLPAPPPLPPAPSAQVAPPELSAPPAEADAETPRRLDPCARPPTAADRLVCNDLALDMLDHELKAAYAHAMAATPDPAALERGQAAWRQARDQASEPQGLAALYDRRIRELNAAAVTGQTPPEPD